MVRFSIWLLIIGVALHARHYAAIDPCFFTPTSYTVEDTAGARYLAEAVNCSGGTFNVEWHGVVNVDVPIAVGEGSTLNITVWIRVQVWMGTGQLNFSWSSRLRWP